MESFQEVNRSELEQVEGGGAVVAGLIIGGAIVVGLLILGSLPEGDSHTLPNPERNRGNTSIGA